MAECYGLKPDWLRGTPLYLLRPTRTHVQGGQCGARKVESTAHGYTLYPVHVSHVDRDQCFYALIIISLCGASPFAPKGKKTEAHAFSRWLRFLGHLRRGKLLQACWRQTLSSAGQSPDGDHESN